MGEEYLPELKTSRVLAIYSQLVNGAILNKAELAQQFHVTQRSIQRDMESLRCFFADEGLDQDIVYDKSNRGYRLVNAQEKKLSNSEVLAVCKILLESRSMVADEMMPILDRLIDCCVPERNKAVVQSLVANERFHYVSPHHGKRILDGLWEIGMAVRNHQVMEIQYERMKEPRLVSRRIEPVGILFSEYYFYLAAFLRGESLKIKTISFLLFIALTGFIPSKFWGSIFMFLIKIASRKENSASGYSSCTAGSWSGSGLDIPGRLLKRCWIGCPQRRSSGRMRTVGL